MRVGIYTYGNLGRGCELAVRAEEDMELVAVFTRRPPESVVTVYESTRVLPVSDALMYENEIDVLLICGGSASDLPTMSLRLAEHFNIVDSFDTHACVEEHFRACNTAAVRSGHTALISAGWDPGIFSLIRMLFSSLGAECHTFWGEGVSQGHSEAIRRIKGVAAAVEYTVPNESAVKTVRCGESVDKYAMHRRICYVTPEEGADTALIRDKIINMPEYFFGYETEVHFISMREMTENHGKMPHGGRVIVSGASGLLCENPYSAEFSIKLSSNPEFTAKLLVAYARAVYKMSLRADFGAKTVLDIPLSDISPLSPIQKRKNFI